MSITSMVTSITEPVDLKSLTFNSLRALEGRGIKPFFQNDTNRSPDGPGPVNGIIATMSESPISTSQLTNSSKIPPPVTTTLTTTITTPKPDDTTRITVTVLSSANGTSSSGKNPNILMMIGIVIGIVVFIVLGGVLFLFRRRNKRGSPRQNKTAFDSECEQHNQTAISTMDSNNRSSSNSLRVHRDNVRQRGLVCNLLMPLRNRHDNTHIANATTTSVVDFESTTEASLISHTITPFRISSTNRPAPDSDGRQGKTTSEDLTVAMEPNPRLSQSVNYVDDVHGGHNSIQNDAINTGLHQSEPENIIRSLPEPPVQVPQPSLRTGDSVAEAAPVLLTVPPPSWRNNLNSTITTLFAGHDSRWHADSGIRLGRGTLLYDEGTNSEWSLQSKDRFPPVYTHN